MRGPRNVKHFSTFHISIINSYYEVLLKENFSEFIVFPFLKDSTVYRLSFIFVNNRFDCPTKRDIILESIKLRIDFQFSSPYNLL